MRKIASPQEFQAELRHFLAYCQGPEKPSRLTISVGLRTLARRIQGRSDAVEGKIITAQDVRITIGKGRWDSVIVIQELPSKPLKRHLARIKYSGVNLSERYWHPSFRGESGGYLSLPSATWLFGAEEMAKRAGLSSGSSFKSAHAGLKKALEQGVKKMEAAYKKVFPKGYVYQNAGTSKATLVKAEKKDLDQAMRWLDDGSKYAISEDKIFYLNVEPHDYEPMVIKGKDWGGTFEWTAFRFSGKSDEDEYMRQMEGMQAYYSSTSAGGARKAFKHLKGDPNAVKGMNQNQFTAWLDKNKIGYRYNPTVWR